jgi:hypothetical protein
MSAKGIVTLTDSTVTGAGPSAEDRDFTPESVVNNTHVYTNSFTGSTSDLVSSLTFSLRKSNANSPVNRCRVALSLPAAKTVDGVEVRDHVDMFIGEFITHKDSTMDNRRDLRTMAIDLLNDDIVGEGVVLQESVW